MRPRLASLAAPCVLLLLGLAMWVTYLPGLEGPFLFDDYQNFIENPSVKMERLTWPEVTEAMHSWPTASRLPNRPLSRLTLGLNHYFSGGRFVADDMKRTNLLIHGLNALLLFLVARKLFQARFDGAQASDVSRATLLALLATAIWALHPVQLSAVLYVVQRMASMSATFVLLGLLLYIAGRERLPSRPVQGTLIMLCGMGACVVLGYFSKQNAILLPFLAGACELGFYSRCGLSASARRGLLLVFGLSVALPVATAIALSPWIWDWVQSNYDIRPFGPGERLMTQGRVLMLYLGLLAVPRLEAFTLWRDDIVISSGLLTPWTTALSAVVILTLLVAALVFTRRRHVWAFAVLFFFAGHALESTIISLELVFEHRNYIPSAGLAIALAYYLWKAACALRMTTASRVAVPLALVLALGFVTHNRARLWSDDAKLARFLVTHNPGSYRAHALLAKALATSQSSVDDIYAAYQGAAAAPVNAVFPLIRMRRLLAGLDYQFELGAVEGVETSEIPRSYEAAVVLNRPYLRQLARLVDMEVARRLRGAVTHIETARELDQVRRCVNVNLDLCWGLRKVALEWVQVALDEGRPAISTRFALLFQAAALHASGGDFENALDFIEQARAIAPNEHGLRQHAALFLGHLGRFEEAEAILNELISEAGGMPSRLENLAATQARVEAMRRDDRSW